MEEMRQIVALELDGQPYGFPVQDVREILQMLEIRTIPDAPSHVRGAINVRGKVVPVLDLRMVLGLPSAGYGLSTPIVVIEPSGRPVGVVVDDVTDVITIDEECFEPPGDSYPISQYLKAVCKLEEGMLLLFDAEKLLGGGLLPEGPESSEE